MSGPTLRIVGVATALSLMIAMPAPAANRMIHREGSCQGPGDWRLQVSGESATTLRVRFDISHVDPGDTWQVFLSDNGTRIFAGTRVADAKGNVHATKITPGRPGPDRIKGSAVNVTDGGSCSGALTY